jgi:CubicO group peptidase (beta-lactamase class C family)
MSKVVTAVAAMQLVERELIGLDDDVRELLPELAGIQVLEGFKECAPNANDTSSQFDNAQPRTEPILRAVEGNITLR